MADTLTPNIKTTIQTEGGNNNTWGGIANDNFDRIDDKLGDTTSIVTTGGDTTLTDNQELVAIIELSGTLVAAANIIFSGRGGFWIIKNGTSGSFDVTCKVSGQTGVQVAQGSQALVYCNGTDIDEGNPTAPIESEVTVASAATADILGAASEFIAISGTTTITSFGTGANRKRFVRATGAFKITHNASSLILPGGQDITTAAGDTFLVISDASSNARVHAYTRASGKAVTSSIPIGFIGYCVRATEPTNWLFCSGKTIGNASSGATARASDSPDTEELFTELWNSHSNTVLPIEDSAGTATTRGASAAADFAANKRLPLPNVQGRVIAGRDNMSGTSANRLANVLDGDVLGNAGGAEQHTLSLAELPSIDMDDYMTDPGHLHPVRQQSSFAGGGNAAHLGTGSGGGQTDTATTGITFSPFGSGSAHDSVQPTIIENAIIYAGAV